MKHSRKFVNSKSVITASLLFSFLLMACAGGGVRNLRVKPFLETLDSWPEEYRSNFQQIRSFSGKARLSIESEQFNGNVSLKTNWVQPDKLYLQAEGPQG